MTQRVGVRIGLGVLAALAAGVILVPMLAAHDPLRIDDVLARRLIPPLGTDAASCSTAISSIRRSLSRTRCSP